MFDLNKLQLENSDNIAKKIKEENEESFERNFRHITYAEKIEKAKQELLNTDPNKIINWWFECWDKTIWWISWWKIYTIWAESWTWKSTFINQVCNNLASQWVRVVKYSLEDRMEDIWKEELFYICNRLRYKDWKDWYDRVRFVNNDFIAAEMWEYINYLNRASDILSKQWIIELEKQKQVDIKDLVKLMEREAIKWTKVFTIDHLHYFKMKGNERTDLEIQNIMHDINEVARKYDIAILLVAHYRKLNKEKPDNDSFKDASAIKQVSNVIIHITRDYDEWTTNFNIAKYRWPVQRKWDIIFSSIFDVNTYTYQQMQRIDNKDEKLWNIIK